MATTTPEEPRDEPQGDAGPGSLVRPETYPERRVREPLRLRGAARRTLVAAIELVVPARTSFRFDAVPFCVDFAERYIACLPPLLRALLPRGLALFDWAAVLLAGGRRFSRLERARRLRYIERVEGARWLSPLAETWRAARGLAVTAFYSHPEVRAHLRYDHQAWLDRKTRERRERFGAPEPW